jgi:hypothetical protein
MGIKHATVYARPGNFIFPDPIDWNADHLFVPEHIPINTGNVTWSNQPSAATELFGNVHRRTKADLTNSTQVRLVARVSTIGAADAIIYAEYSTDENSWSALGNTLAIGGGSAGTRAATWLDVPGGAKGDVFIRVMGSGGDGAADPVLGNIVLQVK